MIVSPTVWCCLLLVCDCASTVWCCLLLVCDCASYCVVLPTAGYLIVSPLCGAAYLLVCGRASTVFVLPTAGM